MPVNPYAPPTAVVQDIEAPVTDAERIRREHILHEIRLKSVGSLYYLVAAMFVLASLPALVFPSQRDAPTSVVIGLVVLLGLAVLMGFLAHGYRRVRPWVKVPGGILSGLGLLGFPLGTLLNGYILYLLFSEKGKTVLSPAYQDVIAATPHVKYKRSVGDWIAIGLVLALFAAIIVFVAISARP